MRPLRQPPLLASGFVIPLFLYGFNVGGLDLATSIPGFPTESYETFALSLMLSFCGIFAFLVAGTALGEDVGSGYLKRVSLTPLRGSVLLVGQLAGVVVVAIVQCIVFLAIGLLVGASVAAGPGGAVAIVGFAAISALGLGAAGQLVALRTRAAEPVQGFYLMFVGLLFLSSVSLPRELIGTDWFQQVATFNPLSYLIEAPRSLLVEGWELQPLALGVMIAVALLASVLVPTARALRTLAVAR